MGNSGHVAGADGAGKVHSSPRLYYRLTEGSGPGRLVENRKVVLKESSFHEIFHRLKIMTR